MCTCVCKCLCENVHVHVCTRVCKHDCVNMYNYVWYVNICTSPFLPHSLSLSSLFIPLPVPPPPPPLSLSIPPSLQLDLAESHDRQPSRLSPIYISLARTHIDCAQFPQAEMYYKKELEYCCLTPLDVS